MTQFFNRLNRNMQIYSSQPDPNRCHDTWNLLNVMCLFCPYMTQCREDTPKISSAVKYLSVTESVLVQLHSSLSHFPKKTSQFFFLPILRNCCCCRSCVHTAAKNGSLWSGVCPQGRAPLSSHTHLPTTLWQSADWLSVFKVCSEVALDHIHHAEEWAAAGGRTGEKDHSGLARLQRETNVSMSWRAMGTRPRTKYLT